MPKREIVPDPVVTIIDDYDGEELHQDTPPERYQLRGRTYELYLSAASKKAVDQFLDDLVSGAEEVEGSAPARRRARSGRTSGSGRSAGVQIRDGYTIHDLREWAKKNGHEVSDNRRAPSKVIEAFNDAHS